MPSKKPKAKASKIEPKPSKLNPKQELFCQLYATDREFFGNGTQSYIEAYDPDQSKPNWYRTARARASELLATPSVFKRINQLLEDGEGGFNDVNVDRQHLFLINQHADLAVKRAALRDYNEVKGRIKRKLDLNASPELTAALEKVSKIMK